MLMKSIRCPICGHRLMDCENKLHVEIHPMDESRSRFTPDVKIKCTRCKSKIGIKKIR